MVAASPARSQVRKAPGSSDLYDVLDLILDKGIVVDAFVRVSLVGIELLTVDLRVVIASVDTYIRYAEAVERLNLRDRSQSAGLPDLVGQESARSKVSQGVEAAKQAVTGDGERHEERRGGMTDTLARGAGAVGQGVSKAVDAVSDAVSGRTEEDQTREQERHEHDRHERAAEGSGAPPGGAKLIDTKAQKERPEGGQGAPHEAAAQSSPHREHTKHAEGQ